jgi:predicted amidophosphoribosyltransferase
MRALVLHWSAELRDWAADAVVWVPGHPLRSRLECDLARFTGEEIAADLRLPTAPSVLERPIRGWRHFWQAQKDRLRSERLHAARGLFRARRAGWPRGTRLLLVDDVTTTGGSLRACREALEDLGFEVAGAFVLAEVPAPKPGSG